jgi:predicted DNA-binding protein
MSQIPLNPEGGKATIIGVKVTASQRERLKAAAGRQRTSMSAVAREAIERHLAELEGPSEDWDIMKAVRKAYVPQ